MSKYSTDDWNQDFQRRVPPILDRYLQEIVRRTTNQRDVADLVSSIQTLIKPVVTDSDASNSWFRIHASDDLDYIRNLEPYVQKFLPYGPVFAYALLGYESLSRFGYTADHLPHLDYIVARIMHDYAPKSYSVIEDMLNRLDSITTSYIRKLEGYTSVSSVLQRYRIDLIGVLYQMAWPPEEHWPNKQESVSLWAKEKLKSLADHFSDDWFLGSDARSHLSQINQEEERRYSATHKTRFGVFPCPYCDLGFNNDADLRRHIAREHE